ncbi:hypothetical protein OF83DRAFT_1176817, partial [Amylostereum chailletii]
MARRGVADSTRTARHPSSPAITKPRNPASPDPSLNSNIFLKLASDTDFSLATPHISRTFPEEGAKDARPLHPYPAAMKYYVANDDSDHPELGAPSTIPIILPVADRSSEIALINAILPTELLVHIFQHLNAVIVDHGTEWYFSPAWITLTHVCAHWRVLILSTPILWTHISLASTTVAETMLDRSQTAPLVIKYGNRLRRVPEQSVYSVLGNLYRAHEVHIECTRALIRHVLPYGFLRPAPLLERLELDAVDGADSLGLPVDLFGGHAPRLRALALRHVALPSDSPLFLHLSSLSLDSFAAACRYGITDIFDILAELHGLKDLNLVNVIRPHTEEPHAYATLGDRTLRLPSLAHISISESTPTCAALVERLQAHPAGLYYLTGKASTSEDCLISSALPPEFRKRTAVSSYRPSGPSPQLYALTLVVQITSFVITGTDASTHPNPRFVFVLHSSRSLDPPDRSGYTSLLDVCSRLALDGVRKLALQLDAVLDSTFAPKAVDALARAVPNVEAIA